MRWTFGEGGFPTPSCYAAKFISVLASPKNPPHPFQLNVSESKASVSELSYTERSFRPL